MIHDFVEFVRASNPDVTGEELADALWLAGFLPGTPARPAGGGPRPPGAVRPTRPATSAGPARQPPPLPPADTRQAALRIGPPRSSPLTDAPEPVRTRSPAVPALADVPAISRALRLLQRKVPVAEAVELDEDATVDRLADTGLWIPRLKPGLERWLDLSLVVDDSASMVVWGRTVAEFRAVLGRLGAFRDIRTWRFDSDADRGERVVVRGADGSAAHQPREFVDPTGRRLVLVVSDCVGDGWGNGAVAATLAQWANAGPVAVVQVLPQRLWDDCGPDFVRVRLRGRGPGTPNHRLVVRTADPDDDVADPGVPVPVLELEPRWLGGWAAMVADAGTRWFTGTALFTNRMDRPAEPAEEPPTADERLRRFRLRSSTVAYRLAVYLACAPLSLPVMRLVQHAMLPTSRPAHLAEVFLSGLLRSAGVAHESSGTDDLRFDFQPGVRAELMSELTRHEALQVLAKVSEFVAHRLGSPFDFRALLTDGAGAEVDALGPPFAKVAREVLHRLGGRYAEAAKRLRVAGPATPTRRPAASGTAEATVPPRNPAFTGRDELLARLRDSLAEDAPLVLVGASGMGKTQIAVEYAHRFRDDYDLVWWISADDPALIRAGLVDLGARLGLPESADAQRTVQSVLEVLRTTGRWLLVFDDPGPPAVLRGLLPTGGHVLVTSRLSEWAAHGRVLSVRELTRPESVALLRAPAPRLTPAEADRVAAALRDHPLALRHAGAWLAETPVPVGEYLGLLARWGEGAQRAYTPWAPWAVAIVSLRADRPDAAALLDLCAHFAPAAIPVDVLAAGRDRPGPLGDLLGDPERLRDAVDHLSRIALVRGDHERGRIEVHGLVQETVRLLLSREQRELSLADAQAVLGAANPEEPDERHNWPRYRELSPHIAAARLLESPDPAARSLVLDHVRHLFAIGDYEGSQALGQSTVELWRARWGTDDESTLSACRHVGNAMRELGRVTEAAELDEDTFQRCTDVFGADHANTLAAAHSLGADLRALGRFAAALALDRDNLARHRRKWGDNHGRTLRTAVNLAVDLRLLGDFGTAYAMDLDVVRRRRELYGPDDTRTLFATCNLVRDLLGMGKHAEALRVQEEVLPTLRGALGPDHNHVLLAGRNLAIALRGTGRYAQARAVAEENLTACERRLGPHHEYTLAARMTLCNALWRSGDLDGAKRMGEHAYRDHLVRHAEPWHPFTLACAINLAVVWRNLGDVRLAFALDRSTFRALRESRGDDHPDTLACAMNISGDLAAQREYDNASALSRETVQRMTRVLGADHPHTVAAAFNSALDEAADGGGDCTEEAVAGLARVLGARHPEVVLAAAGRRLDCDVEPPPT
ncbi:FxSxx-COOH system tetratricopeptide repeat protein [Actinosynnema sp. NPDC047251]|uniref:DUF7779 domain-containing protein n=1 Tax=Saccharothrix espanaensis (strain ATCC 51144 / DSM 44229 / JCM 9112 / NBRC 15066 / NRRL 15764) TaxID=1179773 RepID=K0KDZ3_SACES|nr:FxSxx-COOH system tetratricopeptide repeat protein [Saccharothrix espanaensis]CCH34758.1 hypothetical protein BN6_75330 [Saccharothrix espanaensis DSM 44229]